VKVTTWFKILGTVLVLRHGLKSQKWYRYRWWFFSINTINISHIGNTTLDIGDIG